MFIAFSNSSFGGPAPRPASRGAPHPPNACTQTRDEPASRVARVVTRNLGDFAGDATAAIDADVDSVSIRRPQQPRRPRFDTPVCVPVRTARSPLHSNTTCLEWQRKALSGRRDRRSARCVAVARTARVGTPRRRASPAPCRVAEGRVPMRAIALRRLVRSRRYLVAFRPCAKHQTAPRRTRREAPRRGGYCDSACYVCQSGGRDEDPGRRQACH